MIIFCVNDGAVMDAWAENQQVPSGGLVTLMGDPSGTVTKSLGMVLDHPGPMAKLGYPRSKRFALYAEDGIHFMPITFACHCLFPALVMTSS